MYIVHITSEVAPIAKIGGLADVIIGLSKELSRAGHTVDVCLPKYDCLNTAHLTMGEEGLFRSYFNGAWYDNTAISADYKDELHVTLFESHHPGAFFHRGCVYGTHDDIDRFLYFSRAVLDWLKQQPRVPDVIHLHDWEAAVVAALVREEEFKTYFSKTRVVLTIHNIEYQGWCSSSHLDQIAITSATRAAFEMHGSVNLLRGGIVHADCVTTVSPNYAQEILTPEGGRGLDGILSRLIQEKKIAYRGILNGIDTAFWNPAKDHYIPHRYSAVSTENKLLNKRLVQQQLGLKQDAEQPLMITITRLVSQKGLHLIKHAMRVAGDRYQFILLGVASESSVHDEFIMLQKEVKQRNSVRILLQMNEELAHNLYAASDMCFIPSLFEPCGLAQLIALRYGSVPLVRETGGLKDTIHDGKNGFCFDLPDMASVDHMLKHALSSWHDRAGWAELMHRCMMCDFSWRKPMAEYVSVYRGST